ncbi:hypothetical protein C2E20_1333 isoform A [Micractinium conductrix]|uniref:Uncharacterized protein n=1 Tax=Micractinium conductrix TaxID=554055 RepID=A0A2P6VPA2_9CHLO|nr:hypothetical protein C2E20_1333 isoform A [Micractinium conductrix]|eukprot:PSC75921.1 hypothetical protein C2E20_1333 isoform A [Micractinium conductrix]
MSMADLVQQLGITPSIPNPQAPLLFETLGGSTHDAVIESESPFVLGGIPYGNESNMLDPRDFCSPKMLRAAQAAVEAGGWLPHHPDKAREPAQKALQISPLCPEAHNVLARASGSLQEALGHFRLAEAVIPPDSLEKELSNADGWSRLAMRPYLRRANSANSVLSGGSTSGTSVDPPSGGDLLSGSSSAGASMDPPPPSGALALGRAASFGTGGSAELDAAASGGSHDEQQQQRALGSGAPPPKKDVDAKSSALKALAGVSAIVSKSRKVDAEALQAIKSQRAKARAEGHGPAGGAGAGLTSASSLSAPGPAGRGTPPPPASLGSGDAGVGVSPFASATSQGLVRTPSASNLAAALPPGGPLGQATSLPVSTHAPQPPRSRRSTTSTPPASAADFEALVSKMTITELVALKQAVEGQLAKQALALAQLQASSAPAPAPAADMLSQQDAALLLQSAQQAQLVQQLSSQQAAAHAAAIQQALSATANAAGITSPTFSPEQLLLAAAHSGGGGGGPGGYAAPVQPLGDMASPFASAAYPPTGAGFGLADGPRGGVSLQAQRSYTAGTGTGPNSKSSGSPRSASAEQQLIGEALHSFVDPEQQGPPSRQGSALVNGINWSDRRGPVPPGGALHGAPPPHGGPHAGGGSAFARSRSLPQPQEALYQDRSAFLSNYLGEAAEQALPSLFTTLRMAEQLSQQQRQQGGGGGDGMLQSAFARSGSLQVPMGRGGGAPGLGAMSPPHVVSFADSVQTRTYQPGF